MRWERELTGAAQVGAYPVARRAGLFDALRAVAFGAAAYAAAAGVEAVGQAFAAASRFAFFVAHGFVLRRSVPESLPFATVF